MVETEASAASHEMVREAAACPHHKEALAQLRPDAGATRVELSHHPLLRRLPLAELTLDPVHLVVNIGVIHGLPFYCCSADTLPRRERAERGPPPVRALSLGDR